MHAPSGTQSISAAILAIGGLYYLVASGQDESDRFFTLPGQRWSTYGWGARLVGFTAIGAAVLLLTVASLTGTAWPG